MTPEKAKQVHKLQVVMAMQNRDSQGRGKCVHCQKGPVGLNSHGLCFNCNSKNNMEKYPAAKKERTKTGNTKVRMESSPLKGWEKKPSSGETNFEHGRKLRIRKCLEERRAIFTNLLGRVDRSATLKEVQGMIARLQRVEAKKMETSGVME